MNSSAIDHQQMEPMNSFFPYAQSKEGQQTIMDAIVKSNSPMIIEAGTGSGKTVASLCGLLEKRADNEKILIFVRTINQMNPVLKEWAAINKNNPLTILPLLGRGKLGVKHELSKNTIIRSDKRYNGYPRKKLLKRLKSRNRRHRLLKIISWELEKDPCISNYIDILSTKENDPYQNNWSMLGSADIIIATYGYLNSMGRINREISTDKLHVVFDEAHNFIMDRFYSLKKHHLLWFMKLFYTDDFLKRLYKEIRGLRELKWTDIDPSPDGKIKIIINKLDGARQLVRDNDNSLKNFPPEFLRGNILEDLIKTVRNIFSNYNKGSVLVSRDSINIVDYQPDKTFAKFRSAKSLILQSGTMTPVRLFQKLYGLPSDTVLLDLIEKDMPTIRKDSNAFRAYYGSALTSRSRFRNEGLYKRYASVIMEIFERIPSHVLVLCPSYDFIDRLGEFISTAKIIETSESTPGSLSSAILSSTEKTIILGNQNGKIMEGNEWTVDGRSVVNAVVMTGLATRVPREVDELIIRLRSKILQDENMANLFTHQIPVSIIAQQSFGRTRRHPDDKGALIILDDRVDEFMHDYLCLSRYSQLDMLLDKLGNFFGGNVC